MKQFKRFVFLLALTTSVAVQADDRVLQVWHTDGQIVNISLNEEPVTTYSDGNLVIKTTKNTISYPLEKIKKYTYTTVADGITAPRTMKAAFSKDGETLTFTDVRPNTKIVLYNVAGQLLRVIDSGKDGKATVSISGFPVGVYVVKANGGTYKITKR